MEILITGIIALLMVGILGLLCFQMGKKEGYYDGYIDASDYAISLIDDLNSKLKSGVNEDESN